LYAENNFAYININHILNNSIVGKSITEHINKIKEIKLKEFESTEKKLAEKEQNILKKKNIIDNEEFNKEVDMLKNEINEYNKTKKKFIRELDEKKIEYTKEILNVLNTIISKYVEENAIQMVFSKKDIVIAKKDLDITNPIMDLLNNKLTKIDF
tara:strand:- start:60 stop:524 length:465 start_codon:yes stop_codon:yes gene_type:complete